MNIKKIIAYWPAFLIGLTPFLGMGQGVTTITGISSTIMSIVNAFVYVFWGIAVALALWTAISYITAGGDETKVKKAKQKLIYTIIGFAIAIGINAVKLLLTNVFYGETGTGTQPTFSW